MTNEELMKAAKELGVSENEVKAYFKQLAYRAEYAKRPEVKQARKLYAQKRNDKMRLLRELFAQQQ